EDAPRTAGAAAETDTTLLVFPSRGLTLSEIFERHEDISARMLHKLMALISGRIRRTNLLITEKTRWIEELRRQTLNDKLTGLYNRTFLEEEFYGRFSEYGERVAVLAVKPDNFKEINDSCGHDAGDRVLRMLADEVRSAVGVESTAVRYRGDEYMVILPDSGVREAAPVAGAIMERVAGLDTSAATGGVRVPITVSVGIAEFPADEQDPGSLVEQAFKRMWEARESGGDRTVPPAR
ncbi:MAG TPA: GGDEF domain-containing protein, partial [Spirochaetes bacterium]|nr:GGDEF domain-containing protein [Spirochaetota bacterium]